MEFFRYITNNLLNCASSRLHTLPIIDARFTRLSTLSIIDTRLTCMCIYASLPSSIDHLRAFALSCYKYRFVRRSLRKKVLIKLETTMNTLKDAKF